MQWTAGEVHERTIRLLTAVRCDSAGTVQDQLSGSDHCRGGGRRCREDQLYQMCAGHEEPALFHLDQEEDVIGRSGLHRASAGDRSQAGRH